MLVAALMVLPALAAEKTMNDEKVAQFFAS